MKAHGNFQNYRFRGGCAAGLEQDVA